MGMQNYHQLPSVTAVSNPANTGEPGMGMSMGMGMGMVLQAGGMRGA